MCADGSETGFLFFSPLRGTSSTYDRCDIISAKFIEMIESLDDNSCLPTNLGKVSFRLGFSVSLFL